MTLYTVLAPPQGADETAPDPLGFVFIKEGFCWPALFVPGLWLIARQMWLSVAAYVAVAVLIIIAAAGGDWSMSVLLMLLTRLLFALEANGLRRWSYEREGYRLIDVVEGGRRSEAEIRFFADWQMPEPESVPSTPSTPPAIPPPPGRPSAEAGEVIGLFPAPGGRS